MTTTTRTLESDALAYDVMESAVQTVANATGQIGFEPTFLELTANSGDARIIERFGIARGCIVMTPDNFRGIRRIADALTDGSIDNLVAYVGGIHHAPSGIDAI